MVNRYDGILWKYLKKHKFTTEMEKAAAEENFFHYEELFMIDCVYIKKLK